MKKRLILSATVLNLAAMLASGQAFSADNSEGRGQAKSAFVCDVVTQERLEQKDSATSQEFSLKLNELAANYEEVKSNHEDLNKMDTEISTLESRISLKEKVADAAFALTKKQKEIVEYNVEMLKAIKGRPLSQDAYELLSAQMNSDSEALQGSTRAYSEKVADLNIDKAALSSLLQTKINNMKKVTTEWEQYKASFVAIEPCLKIIKE